MAAFTYEVETEAVSGHYFDSAMKMRSYSNHHRSRIKRSDGVVVWLSGTTFYSREPSRREANEQRRRLEAYLQQNGRCWYDDEQARKAAKKAAADARQALYKRLGHAVTQGINDFLEHKGECPFEPGSPEARIWEIAVEQAVFLPAGAPVRRGQ